MKRTVTVDGGPLSFAEVASVAHRDAVAAVAVAVDVPVAVAPVLLLVALADVPELVALALDGTARGPSPRPVVPACRS